MDPEPPYYTHRDVEDSLPLLVLHRFITVSVHMIDLNRVSTENGHFRKLRFCAHPAEIGHIEVELIAGSDGKSMNLV